MKTLLNGSGTVRRVEAAEAALVADYAAAAGRLFPRLGATSVPVGGGVAAFSGVDSPLSRAVGLGFAGPVAPGELDQVEGFYFSRGMAAQVDLSPLAHPTLRERLAERGYAVLEFNDVLVRPLASLPESRGRSAELSVAAVGPGDVETWVRTIARGFAGSTGVDEVPEMSDVALPFAHLTVLAGRCYLALWEGKPAGGGVMAVHDGLAMLFATSTLPEYRNRGVQAALLDHRLREAAAAGCAAASVQTMPGSASERNVRRAGFELVSTRPTVIRERPRSR